jgi:transposase
MMTSPVAGIDPHQDTYTIGIVAPSGVELTHETFPTSAAGYVDGIELLTAHGVHLVGIEGSASWGAHAAIAFVAAGLDCREVPPQRTAAQRRSRRLGKTDAVDAVAAARALLAEPSLGPVQTLEVYDSLVAKIEAVLEYRRMLVATRTLVLHHAQGQIAKLPVEIRDQLTTTGKIEHRLRRIEHIDTSIVSTMAGEYRLSWLIALIDQDRAASRQIRQLERDIDTLLDEHGTTLRDEPGIGTIATATLLAEVGDPFRFARESKFARWCGTGAVALSSGEGAGLPARHRLDWRGNRRINSVLYIASITQQRHTNQATTYLDRKLAEGKTPREARRAHKRHLANRVIRRMWKDETRRQQHAIHIAA